LRDDAGDATGLDCVEEPLAAMHGPGTAVVVEP
jgi:hypothetical protein